MSHSSYLTPAVLFAAVCLFLSGATYANSIDVVPVGLEGTNFSLEVTPDGGSNKAFVQSDHPMSETVLNVEFTINPQTVTLEHKKLLEIFKAFGAPQHHIRVHLQWNETTQNYKVWLWLRENSDVASDNYRFIGKFTALPGIDTRIRIEWAAATGPGTSDGFARFLKNGIVKGQVTTLDNDERVVNAVRMGVVNGSTGTGATGTDSFLLDEFEATR